MKQLPTWQLIQNSLQTNIPVMLLYVLESAGSSPGRQGFSMAINAKGDMQGSIGGGIMEHKFAEMAIERLKEKSYPLTVRKQYHDKAAVKNQSGMICSGEQTIFLYRVEQKDAEVIDIILETIQNYKNATLQISPQGISFSYDIPEKSFLFSMNSEEDWLFTEKLGLKNHLFIIGSGHCALALSQLMRSMEFYVHLFDDRNDLKTFEENSYAHEKKIIKDYAQLGNFVPSGPNHWVVIMTVGYRTDTIALKALLNNDYPYIGLLGSDTKIKKLFADLHEEGLCESQLKSVHAPIGLPINSQTPEEIAISIAGEIIKLKNSEQLKLFQVSDFKLNAKHEPKI